MSNCGRADLTKGDFMSETASSEHVQRRLDAYVSAWKSYEPDEIADLFTENAIYHRNPKSTSAIGRAAIVESSREPD